MSRVDVRLREWSSVGPTSVQLRGRSLANEEERVLARSLRQSRKVEITELRDGLNITAWAHVGRIHLGDLSITIEPKIAPGQLLRLVRYAYDLGDLETFRATDFAPGFDLFQDLLAKQLHVELTSLIRRGLPRRYVRSFDDLASPRGQIDIGAFVRQSMSGPATRLPCHHYVRSADNHLNRVLVGGVQLARRVAQEAGIRRSLHGLETLLRAEVQEVTLSPAALRKARGLIDRQTRAYEPVLRLIELLYEGVALSFDDEPGVPLPGFLFDMNRFFQALVGKFLRSNLPDATVEDEHTLRGMMRYAPGQNPRARPAPRPRPDFVVHRGRRIVAVLDAKYRDLWEKELPREMLYQLAVYALSQPRPSAAAILYPTGSAEARDARIEILNPTGGAALGYVDLRPVIIRNLVAALDESAAATGTFARSLAYGRSTLVREHMPR